MALSISLPFEREVTNLTVQIGAMCIFLAIVNFLAQLKRAFGIGLYLTMFITIMKTIIRASLVIILFLLAFAIAFYMVLRQIPEFSEMGYSIVRVITMMIGDIGFAETFQQLYFSGQLQNSGLALTLIVLFVVVMNIAFANLLVGLAVGDIHEVMQNADISLIEMDLSLITDTTTCLLPPRLRSMGYRSSYVVRLNKQTSFYDKLKWNELTAGVKLIPSVEVLVPDKRESHDVYNQIKQQELLIKAILDRLDDFRSDVFQRFATNKEDIINVKKEVLESVKERVKKDDDYLL
ncbi:uncharacterized protein TRIADDRAFT_56806 [Trichoplax adhaerens]|uniref:Ion transport domain-containing protein n=1 Tax=Trichoplax adhaerens TaxID=10228 RepID=B3RWM1_TRIAD|nr:hypothetical protein TRIADDRAFT_56806 [Trichoplax adhaerens]EDV24720.1 hypothetical protein TRIADDRAFT_56806 [Trichoplax adhaerens]|eukprot:XP_002112610.1 hypothetical protein TRIADDRAFT_56806 [Trichoplax adhaerens]